MNITEAHINFNLRLQRAQGSLRDAFTTPQIDEFLNQAYLEWIETWFDNARRNKGFEASRESMDRLSPLVVRSPSVQPAIALTAAQANGVYYFNLATLAYELLHYVDSHIVVSECSDRLQVYIYPHGKTSRVQKNPMTRSSLQWRRAVGTISQNSTSDISIYILSNSAFTPTEIHVDYLRKPTPVTLGGYNDYAGNPRVLSDFEISSGFVTEIVDIAVANAAGYLSSPNYQHQLSKTAI